ncbi:MAG: amidohydrolase [Anaerolineaceae bacterium]|nr:amidohydrolase [Anaerolineaceae bacterium]
MLNKALSIKGQIIEWRRHLHQNPELGFEEHQTAKLVSETLESFGLRVQTGVARTGVVAYLGEGKPAIGIRADMDALPLQEENDVPYVSQVANKMHACGHDTHVAMLLGTAKLLSEMEDRPAGEIRFLFQPSEEKWDQDGISGGNLMVAEGALDGLDAVFAQHITSMVPAGQIQIGSGPVMAAVDTFDAVIQGKGGHGAYPHETKDPTFALAQVINAIHGIRSRRIDTLKPMIISIGSIQAGEASNIIPDSVKLNGTMRSYDEETRLQMRAELKKAFSVCQAFGCEEQLTISEGYPATVNNPKVAEMIKQVGLDILGKDGLFTFEQGMGSEDFSYMTQKVPGAIFFLGAELTDKSRPHHNPHFDIDESVLHKGSALLAETALRFLKSF